MSGLFVEWLAERLADDGCVLIATDWRSNASFVWHQWCQYYDGCSFFLPVAEHVATQRPLTSGSPASRPPEKRPAL